MSRQPVDAVAFAQIADHYGYDAHLPLEAVVVAPWKARLPYTIDKVIHTSTHGERVPGHFAYPHESGPGPHPTILLVHGANSYWGRNEDWALDWLDILARAGYCVLCIDNVNHGERLTAPADSGAGPFQRREWMTQTVTDQRRGVDYLLTRPEVDVSRIGLFGGSLGGWIGCVVGGLGSSPVTTCRHVSTMLRSPPGSQISCRSTSATHPQHRPCDRPST